MRSRNSVLTLLRNLAILLLGLLILSQSALKPPDQTSGRVRAFTRDVEFDFVDWTLDALLLKNAYTSLKTPGYMTVEEQRSLVFEYLKLVRWMNRTENEARAIYADPNIDDPHEAAAQKNQQLETLRDMETRLRPIAESVLQYQISTVLADLGLSLGGQPIPPVLYHTTPLPYALIVSPRSVIRQDANISLEPGLTPDEIDVLERQVEGGLDVSALVVPVGGIGTYPTMVMSTTNLPWLTEVVSHEWVHNYLTLRPLGIQYMASGEMRTINETTANIAGKEIGQAVLERYYPELAPPPTPTPQAEPQRPTPTPTPEDPSVFNFNREMRETRLRVDELLSAGKVDEAEQYMEERREFFWENGYQIRRLNQAYFAFYGAYNDQPGGGAGGTDPVGPAVQELRRRSNSLADFLHRIAWVNSFADLQQMVQ